MIFKFNYIDDQVRTHSLRKFEDGDALMGRTYPYSKKYPVVSAIMLHSLMKASYVDFIELVKFIKWG